MDPNKKDFEFELTPEKMIYPVILFESLLGLGGILAGWLFGYLILTFFRLTLDTLIYALVATVPAVTLFFILVLLPVPAIQDVGKKIRESFLPTFSRLGIVDLSLVSLLSGVSEEILFRGFIQTVLVDTMGVIPAILLSSLVFAAAHALTLIYAVLAGIMGLYLGYLFHDSGDLSVPVIVHSIYNFVAFLFYLHSSHFRKD